MFQALDRKRNAQKEELSGAKEKFSHLVITTAIEKIFFLRVSLS